MRSLLRRIDNLEQQHSITADKHLTLNEDYSLSIHSSLPNGETYTKSYFPEPTLKKFHNDKSLVRLIMGPFGSGKSTGCMADVIFHACKISPCADGVRRSRWVMIRNTYGELQTTTLKTWLDWFGNLGKVKTLTKPPYIRHLFNDGEGVVDLEIMFLALDREEHVSKLKSAEYTGAYLNEASELPKAVLETIKGRVGRYPSKSDVGNKPFWFGVIADTNPPDMDSYIYKLFELDKPENHILYKQPPGLIDAESGYETNPGAENLTHLPDNYYVNQSQGASKEFVNVYCKGLYGILSSGKPVYPEYNDDIHSEDNLKPIDGIPIDLSFDFGLTPACLITQYSAEGRLLILQEIVSQDMFIENFVWDMLLPLLSKKYSSFKIGSVVGDPAGVAGYKAGVRTCFDYLREGGFKQAAAALTNDLDPRLNSVKYFLNKLHAGKGALVLSRENCPVLRKGFIKGYEYKKQKILNRDGFKELPTKNEYSHIQDTLQYRCLEYIPQTSSQKKVDPSYYLKAIPRAREGAYAY